MIGCGLKIKHYATPIRNKVILHELCTQKTPKLFFRSHAAELGNPVPKEPLLFLKPVSSYVEMGGAIEVKPLPLAHVHIMSIPLGS